MPLENSSIILLLICMLYDMTSLIILIALLPLVATEQYIGLDVLYFWPLFNLKSISTYTNTITTISGLYTILSLLTSNFVLLYTSCRLNIIYIFFIFSFFFDIIIIFIQHLRLISPFSTCSLILFIIHRIIPNKLLCPQGQHSLTTFFFWRIITHVRKFGTFTMKPCKKER